MKNETVKSWYKENNPEFTMLIFSIVLVALLAVILACAFPSEEYISYPEEEYKTLEKEMVEILDIIIEDNYIDIEKLSEKNIEYSVDYHLSDSESGQNWEISLKEGKISVYATIIKTPDDTLLVEKIERGLTEAQYNELIKTIERNNIGAIAMAGLLLFVSVSVAIFSSFKLIKKSKNKFSVSEKSK